MKWFIDLTTRGKLLTGYGLIIVFLAAMISIAYFGITLMQSSQSSIYRQDFANAMDLMALEGEQNGVRVALLTMIVLSGDDDRAFWNRRIDEHGRKLGTIMRRLLERNKDDPELSDRLMELQAITDAFAETREIILGLIATGEIEEAKSFALGIQEERYRERRVIVDELQQAAVSNASARMLDSEHRARRVVQALMIAGITVVLLAFSMVVILNRLIATPLRTVSDIAGRVADGDLTVEPAAVDRGDEVGELLRAFAAMISNLRRMSREMSESVGVLAASSSEILATTSQVASGASETATAVSETTATVEEVKQTAQAASQKARQVSESAQKVKQVAQTGRGAVEGTVAGMHNIQEQMQSIADGIVRLSEKGREIGEIIATVNDLAEQSNLLAVNAAIEATRAGEQGAGFAVVAQEVKSLAEQSKQATAQVRGILGDIQKATSDAVLATEQGSKAVDAGVRQSAETDAAIRQLADSVNEAAQAASQIAASSQQQIVGMDQVAQAMENIKEASTQNVAGTRQAETAARDLHELGQRLESLIKPRTFRAEP